MNSTLQYNTICIQNIGNFLESLPNNYADLAIIDPPYNLKVAEWDKFKSEKDFLDFSFAWIDLMLQKMKPNGSFYIFNTPYHCALFLHYLQGKAAFQNFITWYKKDGLSYTKKRFVNNQESILFYTMDSVHYYFDCDSVRIPYESTQ